MTPENTRAQAEAVEALIAASLRAPDTESGLTQEEISRYVDQSITLSSEDEAALHKSREALGETIHRILHGEQEVQTPNATPAKSEPVNAQAKGHSSHRASEPFVEAVVIAQLVHLLADSEHPLGRKRYQKLAYLSHRKAEEDVMQHFLKKAAGPYSPWARYQGPETIALRNGYVQRAKVGVLSGFIAGPNADKIQQYLSHYPVCAAVQWAANSFKWRKNDDLELLTTVDFAAIELTRSNRSITWENIKDVIAKNSEWAPKLDRAVFCDIRIAGALMELEGVFPSSYPQ